VSFLQKNDDLKKYSIIDTRQFKDPEVLDKVLNLASEMEELSDLSDNWIRNNELHDSEKDRLVELREKLYLSDYPRKPIMVSLFVQPSTRTSFSFTSAMKRIGGDVFGSENAKDFSSFAKGESIEDAAEVIGGYGDVIVMRHPGDENHPGNKVAVNFANSCPIPVINAGAGTDQHPTQSLLDVYTIRKEKSRLNDLNVAFIGDLKNGRTVRSLIYLLAQHSNNKIDLVSTDDYTLKLDMKEWLREKSPKTGIKFYEYDIDNVVDVLRNADVVYMTRLQKEYETGRTDAANNSAYILTPKHVSEMNKDSIIMHPLPRVDEIDPAVDDDPRSKYFEQAKNGLYTRMALLNMVLTEKHGITDWEYDSEKAANSYK